MGGLKDFPVVKGQWVWLHDLPREVGGAQRYAAD